MSLKRYAGREGQPGQGCRSRTNGGKSRNENGNRIKKSRQKGMNT